MSLFYTKNLSLFFLFPVVPLVVFVVCLFLLYSTMTVVIQMTSATIVNLSILSADFYTLLFGLFLFNYKVCIMIIIFTLTLPLFFFSDLWAMFAQCLSISTTAQKVLPNPPHPLGGIKVQIFKFCNN